MIGNIVGNYKIIQALGEGGVGMVYKGVDTMLDREVAIKVLRPELASQTSVVERFRSEAVTLAKLSHPNIATLFSLFRQGEDLFMVLEFIKGETLDQMLYRRGTIPTDEAIPIFCQALEGINYAHELGIVHRDIKPGNMMLTENGILKVLDFGIARLLGTNRMTRVGNVIGTLEYMSPEQVKGLETDARSDVYGLGIMLYEILTGRLPFESENDFELMKMQTEMMPCPARALNPDIPVEIEAAIMKSVAKNPSDRFQSAGDFLDTLLELGFALPNTTFFNVKKNSRPSKPGINSGETISSEVTIPILQSQIPTDSIPMPELSLTTELPSEVATIIKETKLAQVENSEIKGTRLAPTNPNEIKATRLGDSITDEVSILNSPKSASFFEILTWVHYAGASAILLVFFGLAGAAIILPALWSGSSTVKEEPKKIEQPKPEAPKKTEVVTNPTPQPTVSQPIYSQNPSSPSSTPMPNNPSPVLSDNPPTENPPMEKPNNPPPTKNQPRETVKNNPPSDPKRETKKNPPPGPKPVRTPKPPDNGGGLVPRLTKKDRTDN